MRDPDTYRARTMPHLLVAIDEAREARAQWARARFLMLDPELVRAMEVEAQHTAGRVQAIAGALVTFGIKMPRGGSDV